jgi:ADP-ribosylation factor-like protein 1
LFVLQLAQLKGRPWAIYKASAVKGEGLETGLDWLVGKIPVLRVD